MRVAVSANGRDLDAQVVPNFGHCPVFVFVEAETLQFEAADNPATLSGGGGDVHAAQFVANRGAEAVLSGSIGASAFEVLESMGIPIYRSPGSTVRGAMLSYLSGQLPILTAPS